MAPFADATSDQLADQSWLADRIADLGLEHHHPLAEAFPKNFGGMRIWQTPIQFAPYLIKLADLGIRSYAELGVHAGGSMITTVEYLERFHPVDAVMVADCIMQPEPRDYLGPRGGVCIEGLTTCVEVERWLDAHRPDLVFIDADHSYDGVRRDWEMARKHARYVAFHDIVDWSCPGPPRLWGEIDGSRKFEFVAQYPDSPAPLHGLGIVEVS